MPAAPEVHQNTGTRALSPVRTVDRLTVGMQRIIDQFLDSTCQVKDDLSSHGLRNSDQWEEFASTFPSQDGKDLVLTDGFID